MAPNHRAALFGIGPIQKFFARLDNAPEPEVPLGEASFGHISRQTAAAPRCCRSLTFTSHGGKSLCDKTVR